jgi:hypothetical protein
MNEETITNPIETDKYLPLYLLIAETKGSPTLEQIKEIIELVKKQFPENDNNY